MGPAGTKIVGSEPKRPDQQPGHDLVAHAEAQRGVEHAMREAHRRGQGDHLTAEQGQLHAGLPLGHAIAHRRHASGNLRRGTDLARRGANHARKALEGLMSREHVVVGGDDADIGPAHLSQGLLVGRVRGGETVGEVGAAEALAGAPVPPGLIHALQVLAARYDAARTHALRYAEQDRMQATGLGHKA